MPTFAPPRRRTTSPGIRDLRWTNAEKVIARTVFEQALRAELAGTKREVENRLARIKEAKDLWSVEDYMTRRRQEIDFRYDFRYSVLPEVFGELLGAGRIREQDLRGMGEEKLMFVREYAKMYSRP